MIWVTLTLLSTFQTGQQQSSADPSITVSLVAVQATNEGRRTKFVAPELIAVRQAVIGLDYDTFHQVKARRLRIAYGKESKFEITDRYTLYVRPISKSPDGRVRLNARITMTSKKEPKTAVNALDTTLIMAPGKHLNLGGLRLEVGELIVVLSLQN